MKYRLFIYVSMLGMLLLCAAWMGVHAQERDSLLVMFWNVENFFDWKDQGTGESDKEFSSFGDRHWTKSRFYAKCDAIAKSVMWIGERYGRMPDVIGLAEVENRGVLTKLLNYSLLRKYGYDIVHRDSDDRRGIDVALLYRKSSMSCVSETFIKPVINGVKFPTRDILHACMRFSDGSDVDFIVNHHPSKYGGEKESEIKRYAAMEALRNICDSLGRDNVIAMGDFNDTPDGSQFSMLDGVLDNKGISLHENHEGGHRSGDLPEGQAGNARPAEREEADGKGRSRFLFQELQGEQPRRGHHEKALGRDRAQCQFPMGGRRLPLGYLRSGEALHP